MEGKLTILMRALLAVALVAITLVLTYEFVAGGQRQILWMCRKSACSVYQPEVGSGWLCGRRKYPSTMPATPIVVLRGH